MKYFLRHFNTNLNTKLIIISTIFFFILVNTIRIIFFEQNEIHKELFVAENGNDWDIYINQSIQIKNGQTSNINTTSFLYPYFLAMCFSLFGETALSYWMVQTILLALSTIFIFLLFKNRISFSSLLFLIILIGVALLDINRYYTFRALSENLTLFLLVAFTYFYIKGIEQANRSKELIAAIALGALCLCRPNIFLLAFVIPIHYYLHSKNINKTISFLALLITIISIQPLINYLNGTEYLFFPTEKLTDLKNGYMSAAFNRQNSSKNLFSMLGFMYFIDPAYLWRPHWTLIWIIYISSIIYQIINKIKPEKWEIIMHFILICYLLPIILIFDPTNGNYGYRFFIPHLLILTGYSCYWGIKFTNMLMHKVNK